METLSYSGSAKGLMEYIKGLGVIKCDKCDERGYTVDTPFPNYSAHTCECGWASANMYKHCVDFVFKVNKGLITNFSGR